MTWRRFLHYWLFVRGIHRWRPYGPRLYLLMHWGMNEITFFSSHFRTTFSNASSWMANIVICLDLLKLLFFQSHFRNDVFKCIFLNGKYYLFKISLKLVPKFHTGIISQFPQCIRNQIHNAPFCNRNLPTCAHFCYKMVHCGVWDRCIVGFEQQILCVTLISGRLVRGGIGKPALVSLFCTTVLAQLAPKWKSTVWLEIMR